MKKGNLQGIYGVSTAYLQGKSPDTVGVNLVLFGKYDPDSPTITREYYSKMWSNCRSVIPSVGKVIIVSTPSGLNNFKDLQQ